MFVRIQRFLFAATASIGGYNVLHRGNNKHLLYAAHLQKISPKNKLLFRFFANVHFLLYLCRKIVCYAVYWNNPRSLCQ